MSTQNEKINFQNSSTVFKQIIDTFDEIYLPKVKSDWEKLQDKDQLYPNYAQSLKFLDRSGFISDDGKAMQKIVDLDSFMNIDSEELFNENLKLMRNLYLREYEFLNRLGLTTFEKFKNVKIEYQQKSKLEDESIIKQLDGEILDIINEIYKYESNIADRSTAIVFGKKEIEDFFNTDFKSAIYDCAVIKHFFEKKDGKGLLNYLLIMYIKNDIFNPDGPKRSNLFEEKRLINLVNKNLESWRNLIDYLYSVYKNLECLAEVKAMKIKLKYPKLCFNNHIYGGIYDGKEFEFKFNKELQRLIE